MAYENLGIPLIIETILFPNPTHQKSAYCIFIVSLRQFRPGQFVWAIIDRIGFQCHQIADFSPNIAFIKEYFELHTNKQQFYTSTTTAHGHLITFGCHFAFRCQLRCRRLRCRRQHVWSLLVLPFLTSPIQCIRALKLNASVEGGDVII